MSQIQSFFGGGLPPAGPLLTLTGDIGGPVSPDGLGNINVLGEDLAPSTGFVTVEGSPGTNTLNIAPLLDTVTTNDATPTDFPIAIFTVPASSSVVMSAHVIGNVDDYTAACGGFVIGCARREAAGAAIFVGDNPLASEDAAAGTPQFGIRVTGNSIVVYAQGLAGQTWNWTCTYTYQLQLAV